MLCTIKPSNHREKLVVARLGADGWRVVQHANPLCFDGRAGVLVEKQNHLRWMLAEQTTNHRR